MCWLFAGCPIVAFFVVLLPALRGMLARMLRPILHAMVRGGLFAACMDGWLRPGSESESENQIRNQNQSQTQSQNENKAKNESRQPKHRKINQDQNQSHKQ